MSEKALFYNSLPDPSSPTGHDRNYNADDISDWLDVIMVTGVVKSNTGLKVTPAAGLSVSVDAGKAVINGKGYRNDAPKVFEIDTAPTGSTPRVDFIVLRSDRTMSVRNTYLAYKKGTGADAPALERTDLIYELALAKITVAPFATEIAASAIKDFRGDAESVVETTTGQSVGFCPYMTAVKGYDNYYDAIVLEYSDTVTMNAQSATVLFDIPQYGWTGIDILTVYTNGIRERAENYTISGNAITFSAAKAAGTVVDVVVQKFIDGEGLETVLAQYNDLQARVLELSDTDKYKYICNGINDNIVLSEIAQALHAGTYDEALITREAAIFLAKWGVISPTTLLDGSFIKIDVYGKFGASTPFAGTGTSTSGFQWLSLGKSSAGGKRLCFDFSNVEKIEIYCTAAAKNIIFFGQDVHIIGANVFATCYAAGCDVYMFSGRLGEIVAEKCNFNIVTTGAALIAESGTFINCNTEISTTETSAASFTPMTSARPCVIYGGRHLAYCASTAQTSTVFKVAGANSIIMAYGVNCPTVARNGFYQTNSVRATAGKIYISGIVTALAMLGDAYIEKNGHINMNKP